MTNCNFDSILLKQKNTIKIKLFAVCFFLSVFNLTAQNIGDSWSLAFDNKPIWTSLDTRTHNLYSYDNENITAYDYVNDKTIWTLGLVGYKNAEFSFQNNSPYMKITDSKGFSVGNKKATVINRFSGKVVFDTALIPEFDKTAVYYSKDDKYVLLVRKEIIKKDKKKNIKRTVNRYLTLVQIGVSESLWTIKLPERKMGVMAQDFKIGPIGTDKTIMFSFDGNLLAYNVADGTQKWQKNIAEHRINHVRLPNNGLDNEGFMVMYKVDEKKSFPLNYLSIDTGEPLWKAPFDLGNYYNLNFTPSQIIVKCGNGFNYLNYNGEFQWPENIKVSGKIEKIYAQGNGHFITSSKDGKYFGNWLNEDLTYAFDKPFLLYDKTIIEGINVDGYLIIITKYGIQTFDLDTKKISLKVPIRDINKFNYTINKEKKELLYTTSDKEVPYVIKFKEQKTNVFVEKVPFTKKKDSIMRIESFDGHYSFISRNEVVKLNNQGSEVSRLYYAPPSNTLKTIVALGSIALGTIFAEEAGKINGELYKAGLKDMDDFSDEVTTVAFFHAYTGSAELGMGVVAGQTVNQAISHFEKETIYNPYDKIDKIWMHRSKMDDGGWGLRIIDLEKIEEEYQFEIGKDKNFTYKVDELANIIISSTTKEIKFFKF